MVCRNRLLNGESTTPLAPSAGAWQSGKNFIVHKHYYIRHFQKPTEELNFVREELNFATEQLNYSYTSSRS